MGTKTWDYSEDIFNAMEHRLEELSQKLKKGTFNPAYQHAFTIGCIADIEKELKKILRKEKKK